MKRIFTLGLVIMLVSCGGNTGTKKTWDDVYQMIDSGTSLSVIERTVQEIGAQNHPASMTILRYFDYFMTGDGKNAWEYIEPNSPLAKEIGSYQKLQERISNALKENQYKGVTVKGLSISKADKDGLRMATVRFSLHSYDLLKHKDYEGIANYMIKGKNDIWLIYDIVKPLDVIK